MPLAAEHNAILTAVNGSAPSLTLDAAHLARVQGRLLEWYAEHGRDLPWRRTRDPYAILVAEVMLQQTQVHRVIPKWYAWLEQFPTVASLASATRADAIRAWQGLGYNRRAVRLHAIAQQVVTEFGGELPSDVSRLQQLGGVGRYTAGAVACFAFGQPVSIVETNIRRVLQRVFNVEADPQRVADAALPTGGDAAYAWNQALMDVGATLCRPVQPLCLMCPLQPDCKLDRAAYATDPRPPSEARPRGPAQPRFETTERFVRGRILDALRQLRPGERYSYAELAAIIPGHDATHLMRSSQRLAEEGLVAIDGDELRLPT